MATASVASTASAAAAVATATATATTTATAAATTAATVATAGATSALVSNFVLMYENQKHNFPSSRTECRVSFADACFCMLIFPILYLSRQWQLLLSVVWLLFRLGLGT